MNIVNLSAYHFMPLDDLPVLRARLLEFGHEQALRGTILLSPEGINIMLAGTRSAIDAFKTFILGQLGLAELFFKESFSEFVPFKRYFVKLKKQIIPFAHSVDPAAKTGTYLDPQQLKQWLDEKRDFTLLDVRNDYEVEFGTFAQAKQLNLAHFCDFPVYSKKLPDAAKQKPLVMFCTGGIRCEKAASYLLQTGFDQVYQLEGGILNYFAECGEAHYQGECFVFDERVAVDPHLKPKVNHHFAEKNS